MEIKEVKQQVVTEVTIQTVTYSEDEVKELIRQDLRKKGYKTKSVSLVTSYKINSDPYSCGSYTSSYFKQADAVVESLPAYQKDYS